MLHKGNTWCLMIITNLFHILASLSYHFFFNFGPSDGCQKNLSIIFIWISLMTKHAEPFLNVSHPCVLLLLRIHHLAPYHILLRLFVVLICSFLSSLHIYIDSLSDMYLVNIFSHCVAHFFVLWIFVEKQKPFQFTEAPCIHGCSVSGSQSLFPF